VFGTLGIHIANRAALIRHHARTTTNPIKLVLTSKNTNKSRECRDPAHRVATIHHPKIT